jgi:hypothetical protein
VTEDRRDPEYWRERAEKARLVADQLRNADSRRVLLSIAVSYDMMAEQAAELAGESDNARVSKSSFRVATPQTRS